MVDMARLLERMSPSGFDAWGKCEASWAFRYIEGLSRRPSGAMAAGSGFDTLANDYYLDRVSFGHRMPEEEVQDRFRDAFRHEAEEVDWGSEKAGEQSRIVDQGIAASALWRKTVAAYVEPKVIQPRIEVRVEFGRAHAEPNARLDLSNGITLTGYGDVVGEVSGRPGLTIIDHKFSGKSWSENDLLRETQPVIYSMALGIPRFQFHVARRLKTPKMRILTRNLDAEDSIGILNRYAITRRKIAASFETGDFLPNRKQILCSRKWCGFWRKCEVKYGGKVAA